MKKHRLTILLLVTVVLLATSPRRESGSALDIERPASMGDLEFEQ